MLSCNHLKSSWGRPSQPKKEGRACRLSIVEAKETSWQSWRLNYFAKVGAYYVGCVGDEVGDISDTGGVEDSHDLPCNLSFHWNATNASTRTALNTICLVIVADFWFYYKYLQIRFFIFLTHFFWIHGHPPHIKRYATYYVSVLLSVWQLNKLELCQSFNCISQILQ